MKRRLRFRGRIRGLAPLDLRSLFAIGAALCGVVTVIIGGLLIAGAIVETVRHLWGAVAFTFAVLAVIFSIIGYLSGHIYGTGTGGVVTSGTCAGGVVTTGCTGGITTSGVTMGTHPCFVTGGGTCPFACCCESGTCGRGCPPGGPTQEGGC